MRQFHLGAIIGVTFCFLAGLFPPQTASASGAQVDWIRQYDSGYEPAFDFAFAIAVDSSGNVIVAGSSYGPDQLPDFVTIKYSSAGDTLWVRRYNGPGNNWDIARALAIDDLGNVYVTGETYSSSAYFDFATIKYDASGEQQWVAHYNGPGNSDDVARAIALDESGSVLVTGHSWGSGTSYDYATIKYSASGAQEWVMRYNGPGNTNDQAVDLGVDASGAVYVTGASGEGSQNLSDYVTVKYSSSGIQQWVARYSDWYDYATAIAVGEPGDVFVTGRSYSIGTYYDYATVKYNTMGVQQWVRRYHGCR
jgi:Beta-propeller repeat